jgi:hypothetical protein
MYSEARNLSEGRFPAVRENKSRPQAVGACGQPARARAGCERRLRCGGTGVGLAVRQWQLGWGQAARRRVGGAGGAGGGGTGWREGTWEGCGGPCSRWWQEKGRARAQAKGGGLIGRGRARARLGVGLGPRSQGPGGGGALGVGCGGPAPAAAVCGAAADGLGCGARARDRWGGARPPRRPARGAGLCDEGPADGGRPGRAGLGGTGRGGAGPGRLGWTCRLGACAGAAGASEAGQPGGHSR